MMVAIEHTSTGGPPNHHWGVNADGDGTSPLEVWWNRGPLKKDKKGRTTQEEMLIIRQENEDTHADVVMLTLGQVYDLIDALNRAIERG